MKMQWQQAPWAKHAPYELEQSLDNLEKDDKKAPTLAEAVKEARYILGLFDECGTTSNDMLNGDKESRKEAKGIQSGLKRFIKKYAPAETTSAKVLA